MDVQMELAIVLALALDNVAHKELADLLKMLDALLHRLGLIWLVEPLLDFRSGGIEDGNVSYDFILVLNVIVIGNQSGTYR